MARHYAMHFNAIAAASERERAAKAALVKQASKLRTAAIEEAIAALADAGIIVGQTILTLKRRWRYQDKPVLLRSLTCWSTPVELAQGWSFQAHYVRAKRDGTPDPRCNYDYRNISVPHPSEIAPALLKRLPLWENDPHLPSRATVLAA